MELRYVFKEMRKHHRQGVMLGQTTASTAEEYFGFRAKDVRAIHFHKLGIGKGQWFRLQCGRVVNEVAMPVCSNPDLYDGAWA